MNVADQVDQKADAGQRVKGSPCLDLIPSLTLTAWIYQMEPRTGRRMKENCDADREEAALAAFDLFIRIVPGDRLFRPS
jgi:hypothetical protein